MTKKSPIQWCDSTVNPTMGCNGCELWNSERKICYAGRLHQRHGGHNPGYSPTFDTLTLYAGRMAEAARWSNLQGTMRPGKPWLNGLPRQIFISDMSDALSREITFEFLLEEVIRCVASEIGSRHRWLWLTKRPARMAQFWAWLVRRGISWPVNLWAGTSVTTRKTLTRVDQLCRVGDATTRRFLSVEPQWEPLSLAGRLAEIHWVIQGGQSATTAYPFETEWAMLLRAECRQARVPYFLKQLGTKVLHGGDAYRLVDRHGGNWMEWPRRLRVRQVPRAREWYQRRLRRASL